MVIRRANLGMQRFVVTLITFFTLRFCVWFYDIKLCNYFSLQSLLKINLVL